MAIYHLSAQIIGKGAGRSAVAAAAYRHCAKMEREETGEEIDYSRKSGNAHSEFALPDSAPSWLADFANAYSVAETSAYFWNAVEANEARKDAQLARELVLALPTELSVEQNIDLVRDFVAQELSAYGIVTDWAYHELPDNPHVHLMTSLRPLTEDGFGQKRVPILYEDGNQVRGTDGKIRYEQFTGGMERLKDMRRAWAEIQNQHLTKHGHDIRVDHRSFEDMGIDAVPTTHRGPAADNMDARGEPSELAEKSRLVSRENYRRYADNPDLVLKKITIQKAVFSIHDIAKEIHKTECSVDEFQALFLHVSASDELVPIAAPSFDPFTGTPTSEALYSTKTMVELEHNMVRNIEEIAAKPGVSLSEEQLNETYETFEQARGFDLNDQQKMVVQHLTGERSASALVGYAGAGKSTTIEATRMALEKEGYTVIGGALAGVAAENLRTESGVTSRTLASWEYQWSKDRLLPDNKTIFVMDEAGMVSSDQMERITAKLKEAGARMIVLGDARQLQPIQAGAAFRAFVDVNGYVELDSVVRQKEQWMREAAIAFGSGYAKAGIHAYYSRDRFSWSETSQDARAELIKDWLPLYQANANISVMAHRNKDVSALNAQVRYVLRETGALGEDFIYAAERGERPFATGDRVLFLKNERSLGVFNGTTGTVQVAEDNRLDVLIDGDANPITIRANEYNDIDHGYARTIHKEQGNTVDHSFVYVSPSMDAQLSYVALTRHRDDVKLYVSNEDYESKDDLMERMSRDRLHDTTVLYRAHVDYKDVVQGFAERRGYPTTETVIEFVKSHVAYLRERFDRIASAFDKLRKPAPEKVVVTQEKVSAHVTEEVSVTPRQPAPEPPSMSPLLNQSINRLTHNLGSVEDQGRKARSFERSAHYELNLSDVADELRGFNQNMRHHLGESNIINHGAGRPSPGSEIMHDLAPAWQSFARDNWEQIFAAQWAETRATLEPLSNKQPITQQERTTSMIDQTERPGTLIDAVPDIPPLSPEQLRARAITDERIVPSTSVARDVAGRIFEDRDAALDTILERYAQSGKAKDVVSELERNPSEFGDLKGGTTLGIANSERRNVIEQVPLMAEHAGKVFASVARTETYIKDAYDHLRSVKSQPLIDLSTDAQLFLTRVEEVNQLPSGVPKTDQMKTLLSDAKSIQEVSNFRDQLTQRYGKGQPRIQEGLSGEAGLKHKTEPERQIAISRVNTVLTSIPVIAQMQDQVKQQDRTRELGKDQSRGIER